MISNYDITRQLYLIHERLYAEHFPELKNNLADDLIAVSQTLTTTTILEAYPKGIFPWNQENQSILWWSPDPRLVLYLDEFKISRSLKKVIRQQKFQLSFNQQFEQVIHQCAQLRKVEGTWITPQMLDTYIALHHQGYAHSVECYLENQLVGGLYGLALGNIFFGESMFSQYNNSSKVALAHLVSTIAKKKFVLIDCQVYSDHLHSLGAKNISRNLFVDILQRHANLEKTIF